MEDLLNQLYPRDSEMLVDGLQALKERYGNTSARKTALSHRDSILITYGDGIRRSGEKPLSTLNELATQYLSDCISAIHLLPCFPYSSDDGFSVIDYYRINPDLGDWPEIATLSKGFDLMFDAVINHMSQESEWFQAFLRGEPRYQNYFITADPSEDHSRVVRPRALPLLHPFEKEGATVHVWTTFSRDQVDLNYKDAGVLLQVLDILLFYTSRGARYLRLDAIAFLWKETGTPCIHLDETHAVIQLMRSVLDDICPGTVLITETNVPHSENISYFGNGGNEAHMVYNFTLPPLLAHSLHSGEIDTLTNWARSLDIPPETCFFNFTASHDGIGVRPLQGIVPDTAVTELAGYAEAHGGFVSYKDNGDGTQSPYELNCNYLDLLSSPNENNTLRIDRFMLTQSVMLCMPGVPGIYYHSLLGSCNDRDAALESGIPRRINRAKLDFDSLVQELNNADNYRNRIFTRYKKLLQVRRSQPVFNPYGPALYQSDGLLFIITRSSDDEELQAIHNFSGEVQTYNPGGDDWSDLLGSTVSKEGPITLNPYEFRWMKRAKR
jgi:sucrose phosphorylase